MAVDQVNGNVESSASSSAFIQHLLNYPLISDSVNTVSHTVHGNAYAQRSLRLGDSAYQTLAAPVLPYLARPYHQWLSPYVQRADSLGDTTLARIDERFPAVRKPTAELYSDAKSLLLLPYRKGLEGRDHVLQVYSAQAKKNQPDQGGYFYLAHGKAAVATLLLVSNETLSLASSYVAVKKAQVTKTVKEKTN